MRSDAIESGLIQDSIRTMDQSGSEVAMETNTLTRPQISRLRREFARRIYGRPSYILRRLADVKSFDEFMNHGRNALKLFRSTLGYS